MAGSVDPERRAGFRLRGPVKRRLRRDSVGWDIGLAALVVAVGLFGTAPVARSQGLNGPGVLGYVLVAAAGAPLVFWRRRPMWAFAATGPAVTLYLALGYAWGPILAAGIVAVYGLACRYPLRRALQSAAVLLAASVVAVTAQIIAGPEGDWTMLARVAAWVGLPAAAGVIVRVWRDSAASVRAERARLAATEERLRVAQEVHDVVGHGLAVIAMQSGVALHVLARNPDKAREALEAIRATSKESLGDLRRELDMLRRLDGAAAPYRRRTGRAGLTALIDRVRSGGMDVTVAADKDLDELPADRERAAYRIIQESLTNVLHHAGPGVTANVTVRRNHSTLRVEVTDTGSARVAGPGEFAEGSGIRGMRARVEALGGHLTAGPLPSGGFAVHAELPVQGSAS
jgi:signal transduction histidine kinase